jgi:hypothetical protein
MYLTCAKDRDSVEMDRWIALRFVTAAISSHPNKD